MYNYIQRSFVAEAPFRGSLHSDAVVNSPPGVTFRVRAFLKTCSLEGHTPSTWGSDYHFTNSNFKQTLNSESIVGEIIVRCPSSPWLEGEPFDSERISEPR